MNCCVFPSCYVTAVKKYLAKIGLRERHDRANKMGWYGLWWGDIEDLTFIWNYYFINIITTLTPSLVGKSFEIKYTTNKSVTH